MQSSTFELKNSIFIISLLTFLIWHCQTLTYYFLLHEVYQQLERHNRLVFIYCCHCDCFPWPFRLKNILLKDNPKFIAQAVINYLLYHKTKIHVQLWDRHQALIILFVFTYLTFSILSHIFYNKDIKCQVLVFNHLVII